MNLSGKQPTPKADPVKPDPEYLNAVRALPCATCGRVGATEAHHCRDLPDYGERGLYERIPAMAQKSSDRDAIPLCGPCHRMFHLHRPEFHEAYGKDYKFIAPTRATLADGEIDF